MIQSTTLRLFTASLAAATAFFAFPAALILANDWDYVRFDGTPDNAPVRGLGVLILPTPAICLLLVTTTFLGALLLRRIGQLNPRSLLAVVAIASIGAAVMMTYDRRFGLTDTLFYFGGFTSLAFCITGISAWTWWKVATWRSRTVEHDR